MCHKNTRLDFIKWYPRRKMKGVEFSGMTRQPLKQHQKTYITRERILELMWLLYLWHTNITFLAWSLAWSLAIDYLYYSLHIVFHSCRWLRCEFIKDTTTLQKKKSNFEVIVFTFRAYSQIIVHMYHIKYEKQTKSTQYWWLACQWHSGARLRNQSQ